jgi:hypothetical protein
MIAPALCIWGAASVLVAAAFCFIVNRYPAPRYPVDDDGAPDERG